jgi:hypothetical protein
MTVGDFTGKDCRPTTEEIEGALGSKRAAWDSVLALFRNRQGAKTDLCFYGRSYGWALRVRVDGKALLSLYPGRDRLTAQVVLPLDLTEAALALDPGPAIPDAIAQANPYTEGRWLFIRLDSPESLDDLRRLLELKLGRPLTPAP